MISISTASHLEAKLQEQGFLSREEKYQLDMFRFYNNRFIYYNKRAVTKKRLKNKTARKSRKYNRQH